MFQKSRARSSTASIISQSPSASQTTQSHIHQQPIELQAQPQLHSSPYQEPPQYVAAIPVQPLMANFSSPAVLSPLPVSIPNEKLISIISNANMRNTS